MIRLDVLKELMQEQEDAAPATRNSAWPKYAEKHGHKLDLCKCVGCSRWRGESLPTPPPRPRRARHRGYVWLTDTDDLRVRRAAAKAGVSNAEFVRHAILLRLKQVEEE